MIFFIIGVVAALVALAVLLLSEEGKAAAFIPGVVAVILIGVSCVSYVPTGYTGIVTTFGKVEDGTKDAGVVFKSPWQSIVKMDNRVQEMNMDLSAFSSDIQEVATSVAVGYRINQQNAMTIYKSVGKKYGHSDYSPCAGNGQGRGRPLRCKQSYLEPGCRCITDGHEAAGSTGRVQH